MLQRDNMVESGRNTPRVSTSNLINLLSALQENERWPAQYYGICNLMEHQEIATYIAVTRYVCAIS